MPLVSYKDAYFRRLRNRKYAKGLLAYAFEECLADGEWESFGLLLRDLIEATSSKKAFAKQAKVSRQHLYRLLKRGANPSIMTLQPILKELGFRITIDQDKNSKAA